MNLDSLQPTQESLWNAASQAMASLSPEALRDLWNECFQRSSASHRLTLLYFANEICQRSRKLNPDYLTDRCFGLLLAPAFGLLSQQRPDYVSKISRILAVWEDRAIFSKSELERLRNALSEDSKPAPSAKREKLNRTTPPDLDDTSISPTPQQSEQQADSLLSLDPVLATFARSTSNGSLLNEESSSKESYMLEVVRIGKSLETPKEYEDVFAHIAKAESESIKAELDQENVDRLAMKLYKIVKSKANVQSELASPKGRDVSFESRGGFLQVHESLSTLPFAQKLDQEENAILEEAKAKSDVMDVVETMENLQVDVKSSLASVEARYNQLQTEIDRDQEIVVKLFEILDKVSSVVPLQLTERESQELDELTQQIVICDELQNRFKEEIEKAEKAAEAAAAAAATTHKPRQPRWGAPPPAATAPVTSMFSGQPSSWGPPPPLITASNSNPYPTNWQQPWTQIVPPVSNVYGQMPLNGWPTTGTGQQNPNLAYPQQQPPPPQYNSGRPQFS